MDFNYSRFLLFIFIFHHAFSTQQSCYQDWTRSGQMCLLVKNGYQVTWSEANKDCTGRDATLLRFENGDDVNSFVQLVSKYGVDGWWTDLNEIGHPGIWTWGDNEEVFNDALTWNVEPDDNRHVENCVSLSYEGKMSDEMCWKKLGFICEYPLPADGNCGQDWVSSTDSCYYISFTEDPLNLLTWMDALAKCMSMNSLGQAATLLSINSQAEYTTINQYLSSSKVQDINWWIGLNDQTTEGQYVWTDGPADTTFLKWDKAPSKLSLVDKCGVVHGNGHISYGKCNKDKNYYICKSKVTDSEFSTYEELGCVGGWTRAGHKCYLFDAHEKMTQSNARQHCQQNGGDLIKIQSSDEKNWVTQQTFNRKVTGFWTGLSRKLKGANSWTWADKSDVDIKLINWNQEPNDYIGKEDCATISQDGVYNDYSCSNNAGYICQIQSVNLPCPKGWTMPDAESSMCYYISSTDDNVTTTWYDAKDKCIQMANGGDATLFAPLSSADYMFVSQQLMSLPPDTTGWWTDLTDAQVEGVWQYSNSFNGVPDKSLIVWKGEPNDFGGNEDCAVMYYGGRYNDVSCSAKANIVCEKPATSFPSSGGETVERRINGMVLLISSLIVFNI
ncbi:hypothetical protein LOTGIDRAFT_233857 [Lottia gigantea]|uniref:C-type lectin domain-containing protein n=1 Tax=Lottia gigantea TaxID=225164 RepID=V4A159_LOTGI|nr:hypothetical protein LOTGIDRAFT_233857 [Lottia gigantea]ESO90377.1 hypothetical protein LOTGIDRAFT_233857 [Lottia gigantea]